MSTSLQLPEVDIKENLGEFKKEFTSVRGGNPNGRYASFDYCFNYFKSFKNKSDISTKENMEKSCLHVAFYLASWGMLRGSSFLLQKSIKFYESLINYLSMCNATLWNIDVNEYDEQNIDLLLACKEKIEEILHESKNSVTDTQITKIMLGTFGNVPAFDSYFRKGFGVGTFNRKSLEKISEYYKKNSKLIDDESESTKTLNFDDSKESKNIFYTRAKIIDMIFFVEGLKGV